MQGQFDIFGFRLRGIVDYPDALNAVAFIVLLFRPAVGSLRRFRGFVGRILRLTVVKAVLRMAAELPWRGSALIPVFLVDERRIAVGRLGRLLVAHFVRFLGRRLSGRANG